MTPEQIEMMHAEMEIERTQGFGRWSWYSMIYKLAGGDFLKFDEVCDQSFIGALNFLAFEQENDEKEEAIRKQLKQISRR